MLTDEEFERYLDDLKLDASSRHFISGIRTSPPARAVGEVRIHNVSGTLFSNKTNSTMQYESRTVEALFAWDAEYEREILEYYDQPVTVTIDITDKRGRCNRTTYTPDYVVFRRSGIIFYELKPGSELAKLVAKRPVDWVQEGDIYHYRPAESAFGRLGFTHEVVVAESLSQKRAHNIRLLLKSRQKAITPAESKKLDRLVKHVERYGPLPMDRALSDMDVKDISLAINAIDCGRLAVDINSCLLTDPKSAWLANDLEQLSSIESISKGYLGDGTSIESIAEIDFPRPGEHQRILTRLAKINGAIPAQVHPSTVRRWKQRLRENGGDPTVLSSHYARCGLRGFRIHPDHLAHLVDFHKEEFATCEARSERAVHRQYVVELKDAAAWTEEWGAPVCLETYRKYVSTLDPEPIQRMRGGKPAANAAALPVDPDKVGLTSRYAFEVAQIDHYLADCYVVVAKTGKKVYCARPWVTLMVDLYSNCVLGLWIGLSAPSCKACAMVIRDCARRHGRLPDCIRVDNGADFQSVYFDMLMATLRISKEHRPASDPRYGSEVERLFKTLREEFLDDLPGNIKNNERNRSVAKAFRGEAVAALDIEHFFQFTQEYLDEDYNAHPRSRNTTAPSILLEESIEKLSIAGIAAELDAKLMLMTALPAPSTSYKIDRVDGIRVAERRYRSSEMLFMSAQGTHRAEIRIEPYDDTFIYVNDAVQEKWHVAQTISASLDLAPINRRPSFDALLRREGASVRKGIKLERDRYYVAKRKENRKILEANGIDFLDLTDESVSEASPNEESLPPTIYSAPTQIRQIKAFRGFA